MGAENYDQNENNTNGNQNDNSGQNQLPAENIKAKLLFFVVAIAALGAGKLLGVF